MEKCVVTEYIAGLAAVLKWPTSLARNWNTTRFSTSLESACINTCLLLSNCLWTILSFLD